MKTTFLKTIAGIALVVASAGAVAGKSDNSMVVAINQEIQTLDGYYATTRESIILHLLTSDQLVSVVPGSHEYKPALAESFRFVDPKTIEFVIRKGVKFHDGSDLTVDDVVYSIDWAASDEGKTRRRGLINFWFDSVEKVDERTLRVNMKQPYPLALRDIAMFVQTRKEGTYNQDGKVNIDAQAQQLNGTGPYKVSSFAMGKGLVLERFKDYYADSPKGQPKLDKLVLQPITEWGTLTAEMMAGNVHWSYNVPDDIAQNVMAFPAIDHTTGPSLRVAFMNMDAKGVTGKDNPLTNLKVRQALNHAVNRESITRHLIKGTAAVINAACHPAQFGCSGDVTEYEYNPEKAKSLLAEAGYPNGFEFEMWGYRDKPVAEAMVADFAKIGVKVNVRWAKIGTLNKARREERLQAYFGSWGSYGTFDVAAISNHFVSGSDRNLNGDKVVVSLFEQAQSINNSDIRESLYDDAFKRIAENAYWIPLFSYSVNYLASKEVEFSAWEDGVPRLYELGWK